VWAALCMTRSRLLCVRSHSMSMFRSRIIVVLAPSVPVIR
jgi:hypothetical protein